jgi:hypothetical protein
MQPSYSALPRRNRTRYIEVMIHACGDGVCALAHISASIFYRSQPVAVDAGNGDDARRQRDSIAFESSRVTVAVEALIMRSIVDHKKRPPDMSTSRGPESANQLRRGKNWRQTKQNNAPPRKLVMCDIAQIGHNIS